MTGTRSQHGLDPSAEGLQQILRHEGLDRTAARVSNDTAAARTRPR